MSMLNITNADIAATKRIAEIIQYIKNNENDFAFANNVTDELYRHQPFILSMLMGYKMDLTSEELAPLVELYVLIWEYYKDNLNIRSVPITQQHYERAEAGNTRVLKNYANIASRKGGQGFLKNDLNRAASKALISAVFMQFREKISLRNLNTQTKGMLLIGLKSVIQCFDEVSAGTRK